MFVDSWSITKSCHINPVLKYNCTEKVYRAPRTMSSTAMSNLRCAYGMIAVALLISEKEIPMFTPNAIYESRSVVCRMLRLSICSTNNTLFMRLAKPLERIPPTGSFLPKLYTMRRLTQMHWLSCHWELRRLISRMNDRQLTWDNVPGQSAYHIKNKRWAQIPFFVRSVAA